MEKELVGVDFNKPCITGNEMAHVNKCLSNNKLCGDGYYNQACSEWIEEKFSVHKAFLTPSATSALEMAALLTVDKKGDEVIMPSYTFVSTANAFVLRNAVPVFVDIRPDTMNIDEKLIEEAITEKTKAIVAVHYAGVACDMDKLQSIATKYNLFLIEDAAQAVMSSYKGRSLGSIGDIGCYSFHETKNYTCGEGGAILINNRALTERGEIIREKGTDRSKYIRGQVDKYTWVDIGSSFLISELCAAFLYGQLEMVEEILRDRMETWNLYYKGLEYLQGKGQLELPVIPDGCQHNAHMFYIKCKDIDERTRLIDHLKRKNIYAAFHYVPLHGSSAGTCYGRFNGEDKWTTRESERLLRFPLYYRIPKEHALRVLKSIHSFYR